MNIYQTALIKPSLIALTLALGGIVTANAQGRLPICPSFGVKNNCSGDIRYPNGQKYSGDFVNGQRSGKGTLSYPNGERYTGEFINDMPDGYGSYLYSDGSRYEGGYSNGQLNGQGTYINKNGEKFVGQYRDDVRSGEGTLYRRNGTVLKSGYWENNTLVSSAPEVTRSSAMVGTAVVAGTVASAGAAGISTQELENLRRELIDTRLKQQALESAQIKERQQINEEFASLKKEIQEGKRKQQQLEAELAKERQLEPQKQASTPKKGKSSSM